ncbi:MAG: SAM-dependent methyltransferase, partial [Beijerinckiaceae bacterium]
MIAPDAYHPGIDVVGAFHAEISARRPRRVLEVGTRRVDPEKHTHARDWFPWLADEDYVKLDVRDGIDVDVVGDLHALPAEWTGRFDCFMAGAVFEHLERP